MTTIFFKGCLGDFGFYEEKEKNVLYLDDIGFFDVKLGNILTFLVQMVDVSKLVLYDAIMDITSLPQNRHFGCLIWLN